MSTETMTLNLRPEEMAVVEQLAEAHGLSKTAVVRQALRIYQMVDRRLRDGETMSFSGDPKRVVEFVGIGFPPPSNNPKGEAGRAALQDGPSS